MYTVGTITELGGTKSIDNDVNLGVYSLVSPMHTALRGGQMSKLKIGFHSP